MSVGCSSTEESSSGISGRSETPSESVKQNSTASKTAAPKNTASLPKPAVRKQSSSQQFSVHADTVDVHRKKKQGNQATPISVKASTPKRFYTVEVGAFRRQSNIQRHQEQLVKRFKLPVRTLFDSTISLTRVSVGTFSTKSMAVEFMKSMHTRFPKDYPDLWVSYWTK